MREEDTHPRGLRSYHQGPVVCLDHGGANVWSWSANGADDRTALPLLPPRRCNLPKKARTVMTLINNTRAWLAQRGQRWDQGLTLVPPPSVTTTECWQIP